VSFKQPELKRVQAGWLAKSVADARRWAENPKNKAWFDAVRENWKPHD